MSYYDVDDGWIWAYEHRDNAGVDGTIMDAVFEGFTWLISEVIDFSTQYNLNGLLVRGQCGQKYECNSGECERLFHIFLGYVGVINTLCLRYPQNCAMVLRFL